MSNGITQSDFLKSKIKTLKKGFKLVVCGESMLPTIKNGDEIGVVPISQIERKLKVNDIIVFKKFETHYTVHRIKEINYLNERRFYCQTKGDNNTDEDSYVVFNHEIIGLVIIE